jgi:methyl-accepting chemotaxis protein
VTGVQTCALPIFADALVALLKASLLDMDLSISVYLSELEDRRRAAEDARLAGEQNQAQAVRAIASALSRLACGDLRSRIDETLAPEFESLKGDYNAALDRLQECMEDVARAASMISDATGEITDSSEDLSKRTEARAANLEQTSAALVQINQSVRQTAGNTASVDDIMTRTRADAEQSGDIVADAMQTMAAIERSSKNANQIIVVIDEIAFQTNLLALNAGVEAARAGEAGRGFAVVAAEVRSLAQRSSEAAKEIEQLLGDTQTQIRQGVTLVENTVAALSKIGAQVSSASLVVTDITKSAREQATVLDQIAKALDQLDHATQQDAAMVQETSAATRSLRKETDALIAAVRRFELAAASASVERRHTPLRLVGGR